ncbi:hypothetical protein AWB68_08831 [Caballeronia choica]|uniref:Uncharacterized protein n=1 Tax=Caballeronia choica TaxID=326476 RepID=A0A158L6K3_9BURK|nr:hypothetical protein AWB68_08831 [Caballeronia choica]
MLRLETLSQFADGRPVAARIAPDVQQQQVLQRRDALAVRRLFRETLEAPHLIAKLRQLFEILLGQAARRPADEFLHRDASSSENEKIYHKMILNAAKQRVRRRNAGSGGFALM